MNEPRPRPRAFRLDDAQAIIEPEFEEIPAAAHEIQLDEGEREIEIAQQRGMLARWRPSLGALLWAYGVWSVTTALAPRRAVVGLLGFATALSWSLYMGLFAYWISYGIRDCNDGTSNTVARGLAPTQQ